MTETRASEREERWTVYVSSEGVTMGVEGAKGGMVAMGKNHYEAIEVVPATLLTEALEAIEGHVAEVNRASSDDEWGDDFDADVAEALGTLKETARSIRSRLDRHTE